MNQADAIRKKLNEIEAANQVKFCMRWNREAEHGVLPRRTATMTCDMCSFAQ